MIDLQRVVQAPKLITQSAAEIGFLRLGKNVLQPLLKSVAPHSYDQPFRIFWNVKRILPRVAFLESNPRFARVEIRNEFSLLVFFEIAFLDKEFYQVGVLVVEVFKLAQDVIAVFEQMLGDLVYRLLNPRIRVA